MENWQNIRAAWHQALAYPLISEIGQFAHFLSLFYEFRGLIHEGEETFGLALAQLRAQLVIILNHPQCSVVARHKAKLMVPELRAHLTADEINAVTEKVKRNQLSNGYIEPNFRVDAKFIDRLLELIGQAGLAEI